MISTRLIFIFFSSSLTFLESISSEKKIISTALYPCFLLFAFKSSVRPRRRPRWNSGCSGFFWNPRSNKGLGFGLSRSGTAPGLVLTLLPEQLYRRGIPSFESLHPEEGLRFRLP